MLHLRLFLKHIAVKVVPEIVSTGDSPVPVIDSKESTFLPLYSAMLWFGGVEDDCNSIFIVGSTRSLVSARCVAFDYAICLD